MQYILQRLNWTLRAVRLKGITILNITTRTAKSRPEVNLFGTSTILKLVTKQGSYYVREPLLYLLCKIIMCNKFNRISFVTSLIHWKLKFKIMPSLPSHNHAGFSEHTFQMYSFAYFPPIHNCQCRFRSFTHVNILYWISLVHWPKRKVIANNIVQYKGCLF